MSAEPLLAEPVETLVEAVMAVIRQRIATRSLAPGARAPSLRRLAETLAVSKSTVVEAYDRLAADGAIVARPGSGFYVSRRTRPLSLAPRERPVDRAIDPLWIMRQSLDQGAGALRPGCGWLPPRWLPEAALRRAMRGLARDGEADLAEYDAPLGFAPLRRHLADRLDGSGIAADPDRILLTDSGTQGIDLVCRFLLQPGDTVLLDDPCYFNFQTILRAHRAVVVGVSPTPRRGRTWTPSPAPLPSTARSSTSPTPRCTTRPAPACRPPACTVS